jgi:mRNA-degrading endonuclease RelE of RelBE toxin-antitoxin system
LRAEDYELIVAGPVARAIAEQLPEAAAIAVIEFLTGPLVEQPHRIGTPLRRELAGLHSARRGTFRILYRIDDNSRVVTVVRVEHRSDVYRPR